MFSKIKILGHPIHPMLVSFPITFYSATLVAFIVYAVNGDLFWLRAAITANIGGVGMAVVAAVPGMLDFINIPRGNAKSTGWKHMLCNIAALILFGVNVLIYGQKWGVGEEITNTTLPIFLCSAGMFFTLLAGFFGWEMVQRHHVGIDLKPEQKALEPQNELDAELERRKVY